MRGEVGNGCVGDFFPSQGIQYDTMSAYWLYRLQRYAADCKTPRTMTFKSVCRGRWKSSQKATWFLENIAVLFKDLVGERHMNQSCNWFPIESGLIIHSSSWCEDYGRAKKFKWVPLCLDAKCIVRLNEKRCIFQLLYSWILRFSIENVESGSTGLLPCKGRLV